jgi:vancomycin resistance protein YoaR
MRRMAVTFGVTLMAIILFGSAFAVGYARVNEGHVLPGVDVGGVALAGLDRPSAANRLRLSLPSLAKGNLVIEIGDTTSSVPFSAIDRDYDMEFMLDQALGVGRASNFLEQLQEQLRTLISGTSINAVAVWNNDALVRKVSTIAMAAQIEPISASLSRVDGRYIVNPSSPGQSVDVEEAVSSAMAAVDNISPGDAHVNVATAVVPPRIDTATAQAAADLAEQVMGTDVRVAGLQQSMTIASAELRGWVHLDLNAEGTNWQLVIERAPIAAAVANHALINDIPAQNASFKFEDGGIAVVPSADGLATNIETTTDSIMAVLEDRAGGAPGGVATLTLDSVPPTFTTAEATALAPQITKLGEWTTHYVPSPLNGEGVNIQIPTSIINGYVVEPGGLFDYLSVIGPITSPPYTSGAAIVRGHTVMEGVLGGGMCSSSTTIFNAALRAGLDMRDRGNHAYYISRYPLGLDATVWISNARRLTMSFVNDTGYPILIRGINDPGEVTFQIFGVDDGRTVEFSDPVVTNPVASVDYLTYVDTLPAGTRNRVEFNADGMDVSVTRTVRDAAGNVIHEDTFISDYKTVNGMSEVGRYPGDPPAGTVIPASEYPH